MLVKLASFTLSSFPFQFELNSGRIYFKLLSLIQIDDGDDGDDGDDDGDDNDDDDDLRDNNNDHNDNGTRKKNSFRKATFIRFSFNAHRTFFFQSEDADCNCKIGKEKRLKKKERIRR